MSDTASTAILLFSRTARQEAAVKTFHHQLNREGNLAIAKWLIGQSLTISKKTCLPIFPCYDINQTGASFGERLANAIETIFSQGYSKLIVIGNDCPSINTSLLLDVDESLANEKIVLGPATDGGVYLIGLQRSAYKRGAFIALPWTQANLQDAWKRYADENQQSINWLECLSDIDEALDLKIWLKAQPKESLNRKRLLRLVASFKHVNILDNRPFTLLTAGVRLPTLRAPPSFFSAFLF